MSYFIKRECWNEKTYNGYTDNPYWRIEFSCYIIGLSDDGKYWGIGDVQDVKTWNVIEMLNKIIDECNLKINLKELTHEDLIEMTIEQIKQEITTEDTTHIRILLNNLKEEDLLHYLPQK